MLTLNASYTKNKTIKVHQLRLHNYTHTYRHVHNNTILFANNKFEFTLINIVPQVRIGAGLLRNVFKIKLEHFIKNKIMN